MNNKLKYILISIGIIVLLLLTKGWWTPKLIIALGGYVNQKEKIVTEIEYRVGDIDTLAVFNKWVESQGITINPEPIIEYIQINNSNTSEPEGTKTFTVHINDSLLDGNFKATNNFKGDLLSAKFNYKPKFPKLIKQVDTVFTTTTITKTLDNKRGMIGIGVGYNSLDYPSAIISYKTPKELQFMLEYGKPTNDIKGIINGAPFTLEREDLWSFKIVKHF